MLVPSHHPLVFQSSLAGPLYEKPVAATTIPVTVTPRSAMNFMNMKMSALRVPTFVETQFNNVTKTRPAKATVLFSQSLASAASAPIMARTRYSPKMIAMMAAEPGFSTQTAHQVNKNPAHSPNVFER